MATPRYGRRRDRGLMAAVSRLLDEIRSPTTPRAKIIVGIFGVIAFSLLGLVVVGGFFVARAVMPLQAGETIDPTAFLGNAQTLEFQTPDGQTHSGWFFPGLRGAPVIIICHGYKSARSEILTLATSMQQHRYNVFAFNFAGHGESPVGHTTLGYREAEELQAALEMLAARTDVDSKRMGVWGYSLGGYAALAAAPRSPMVKAVAMDSVYGHPSDLLQLELRHSGARSVPLLTSIATFEFRLWTLPYSRQTAAAEALEKLSGTPKLFIAGDDAPELGALTQALYDQAPGPKEVVVLPRTDVPSLIEDERRNYENLVVTFFLRNLPLVAPSS